MAESEGLIAPGQNQPLVAAINDTEIEKCNTVAGRDKLAGVILRAKSLRVSRFELATLITINVATTAFVVVCIARPIFPSNSGPLAASIHTLYILGTTIIVSAVGATTIALLRRLWFDRLIDRTAVAAQGVVTTVWGELSSGLEQSSNRSNLSLYSCLCSSSVLSLPVSWRQSHRSTVKLLTHRRSIFVVTMNMQPTASTYPLHHQMPATNESSLMAAILFSRILLRTTIAQQIT